MAKEEKSPDKPVLAKYEGKFVFEGLAFRKLRNGHHLRCILECDFDEEAMGALAALLEKHVEVRFVASLTPKEKEEAAQAKIDFDSKPGKN